MSARAWRYRKIGAFKINLSAKRRAQVERLVSIQERDGALGWYKHHLRQIDQFPKPPVAIKRSRRG